MGEITKFNIGDAVTKLTPSSIGDTTYTKVKMILLGFTE